MRRAIVGDGLARQDFGDFAAQHHREPVAHVIDDGEVMGHHDIGKAALFAQPLQQVEDFRLHRDIERRRRLIEQQQRRLENQRPRNRHALPLAAGKLVRETIQKRYGQADIGDDLAHALFAVAKLVDRKRFRKHGAHRLAGMQGTIGVLKHHLQHAAPLDQRHVAHRSAVDKDIAGPEIVEHGDAAKHGGFARTAFADQPEALARLDAEGYGRQHFQRRVAAAESDGEIAGFDGNGHYTFSSSHSGRRSSTASGARVPPMRGCAASRPRV
ncbi:hypothetical protein D3C86_1456050 [compost metagenome]